MTAVNEGQEGEARSASRSGVRNAFMFSFSMYLSNVFNHLGVPKYNPETLSTAALDMVNANNRLLSSCKANHILRALLCTS